MKRDAIAIVPPEAVKFMGASVVESESNELANPPRDEHGRQMAVGVVKYLLDGEPLVIVSMVLGEKQMTLTLTPSQADQFCHALADATLWQNEQLRHNAGQAVH